MGSLVVPGRGELVVARAQAGGDSNCLSAPRTVRAREGVELVCRTGLAGVKIELRSQTGAGCRAQIRRRLWAFPDQHCRGTGK